VTALDRELARALVAAVRDDVELRAQLRALLFREKVAEADSPWLGIDEAAAYLRISERTLARRIAGGRVRSTTIGRRRLLHREDLDALANAATGEGVASTTPPHRRTGVR
jgi:excisionase family DNA binding protein